MDLQIFFFMDLFFVVRRFVLSNRRFLCPEYHPPCFHRSPNYPSSDKQEEGISTTFCLFRGHFRFGDDTDHGNMDGRASSLMYRRPSESLKCSEQILVRLVKLKSFEASLRIFTSQNLQRIRKWYSFTPAIK